jgi:hypothetical protein
MVIVGENMRKVDESSDSRGDEDEAYEHSCPPHTLETRKLNSNSRIDYCRTKSELWRV